VFPSLSSEKKPLTIWVPDLIRKYHALLREEPAMIVQKNGENIAGSNYPEMTVKLGFVVCEIERDGDKFEVVLTGHDVERAKSIFEKWVMRKHSWQSE